MEIALNVISSIFLVLGCFLLLSGVVGIIRFPDFYTRVHAAGITDTLAASFILVGLMFLAGWGIVLFKLAFILAFILLTSPTASHALSKAAWKAGIRPQGLVSDIEKSEDK